MKSKFILLSLAAMLSGSLAVMAQNDKPATNTNQPANSASAATNSAATNSPAPAAEAAAPAPATNSTPTATAAPVAAAPDAVAATAVAASTNDTTTAAAADATAAAASATASAANATANAANATTAAANAAAAAAAVAPAAAAPVTDATAANAAGAGNAARDPNAVIPLIVMDEVPLTDAIKNLARQAGLNYMLDPKINYGVPGPGGTVNPQPMVSLRWENLTPDQALSAVLNNYNLVLVDDPKTHIARITMRDPAAPDPLVTKIIQLKYAWATNLVGDVQTVLQDKRSKVIADARTSQLVVLATEKEIESVDEMVARLDTQTKQVLIEARIIETSKNPTSAKGIDWSGTLAAQHVVFGNGTTTGTVTTSDGSGTAQNAGTGSLPVPILGVPFIGPNPTTLVTTRGGIASPSATGSGSVSSSTANQLLQTTVGNGGLTWNTLKGFSPATAFLNADGVSAVLSFLNSDLDATVLSTPRAVTLDNETATLSVTRAQPIFQTTAGTLGSLGGTTISYTNLGTILKVTPRISANNTISLKVIPEVSDVAGTISKTVGGLVNQADAFDVRRIETQVLIPSGNTLVMGGLMADNRSKGYTKVPGLGDVPFLGAAFRNQTKSQLKQNLIIFITPTIVRDEDFQPTEAPFLKSKIATTPNSDFGAWDSGAPQDWHKLWHKSKTPVDDTPDVKGN